MTGIALSAAVFEQLSRQLAIIKEKNEGQVRFFGLEPSELDGMLEIYVRRLGELLESARESGSEDASVPFVVIGSDVEVRDLDSGDDELYHIATLEAFKPGANMVTLRSPVGKAFFLKEPGDSVDIRVPSGVIRYRIKSIRLNPETDTEPYFAPV